jgi:hypothetical protein
MYAFKDSVYLVTGVVILLIGSIIMTAGTLGTATFGFLLVILGVAMSTFAAYQIGLASKSARK